MNGTKIPAMTMQELKAMLDAGTIARGEAVLLDVREARELTISALPHATHVPMGHVPAAIDTLDRAKRHVVLCRVGGRSAQVTAYLRRHGIDAVNLTGGINAYAQQIDPSLKTY